MKFASQRIDRNKIKHIDLQILNMKRAVALRKNILLNATALYLDYSDKKRDNIFIDLIKNLYMADTPTNILPSIHVYNSIAIMIAVWRSKCFASHKMIKAAMLLLGASIICSTVLIKQHSMLDVLLAFLLSAVMYSICYKRTPVREKRTAFQKSE